MHDPNFKKITIFENYDIKLILEGHAIVTTKVTEAALNLYGNAHGGYLFSLCDSVSGYVMIHWGINVVTLQSSINYIKAAKLGDTLSIEAITVHNGKNTKVVETSIRNQDEKLIAKGTFTMYAVDIEKK